MTWIQEFKEFAIKGNVVDMAVGVVIGTAFGKIVSSLVNDLVMPLFAALIGEGQFKNYRWVLQQATGEQKEVAILYGSFIQVVIDFLIIASAVFFAIKLLNQLKRKREVEQKVTPTPLPADTQLLTEIRDLLKK